MSYFRYLFHPPRKYFLKGLGTIVEEGLQKYSMLILINVNILSHSQLSTTFVISSGNWKFGYFVIVIFLDKIVKWYIFLPNYANPQPTLYKTAFVPISPTALHVDASNCQ